jgi:cobalt/nickel transport system permease protein
MIEEPFANGNSFIHQIDPKLRIISAVLISVEIALFKHLPVLGCALFMAIFAIFLARLNFKCVIKRLYVIFWFLLLVWVTLPITFEGEVIYKLGSLNISRPGIILSAQISFKSISILFIFMTMISTMSINTLGRSLSALHCPSKLVHLLLMTYRYIFVIDNEYRRLQKAIKMRGFRSRTTIHSYKTYAYLIGMLFVRASYRAKRVHQAMLCRGFNGKFYSLEETSTSQTDIPFACIMTIIFIGLVSLEFFSYGNT